MPLARSTISTSSIRLEERRRSNAVPPCPQVRSAEQPGARRVPNPARGWRFQFGEERVKKKEDVYEYFTNKPTLERLGVWINREWLIGVIDPVILLE